MILYTSKPQGLRHREIETVKGLLLIGLDCSREINMYDYSIHVCVETQNVISNNNE